MSLRLAGEEFNVVQGLDAQGWPREIEANDAAPGLKITQSGAGSHIEFNEAGMIATASGNLTLNPAGLVLLASGKELRFGASTTRIYRVTSGVFGFVAGPTNGGLALQLDTAPDGGTALSVRRNLSGAYTLQPVSMGAVDSGGSGYRYLRVPN